jgi:hypothetical protein
MNMTRRLLAILAVALLAACSGKPALQSYASEAGRFSVMVPDQMDEQADLEMYLDEETEVTLHTVERDDVRYQVAYLDIPEDENAEWRRKGGSTSFIPGEDTMIINEGWIVKNSVGMSTIGPAGRQVHGHRFNYTLGKQITLVNSFWHGNRIYRVTATRPVQPSFEQERDADRFLESFKLL